MFSKKLVYALVIVWLAVFVGSIIMTINVQGPRNIDTAFKALDTLFRWQLLAFLLALMAAVAGFLGKENGKREKLLGLAPIGLTVLAVAGLVIISTIIGNRPPPAAPNPMTPTAPAAALPAE